jgi:hypothetical protein
MSDMLMGRGELIDVLSSMAGGVEGWTHDQWTAVSDAFAWTADGMRSAGWSAGAAQMEAIESVLHDMRAGR